MFDPGFADVLIRLRRADRVLLVSDGRPDGDSIGATTATLQWLERDFPSLRIGVFCAETVPPSLLCLDRVLAVRNDPALFTEPWDLVITHDASDLAHCGIETLLPAMPKGYVLVNIDHHATNRRFGDINIVQTDACATTEVLCRCFKQAGIRPSAGMATSLLAGLLTDTGSFGNAGTTASGLAAAGELIRLGARHQEILASTMTHQSLDRFHLWGKALSRLHKHPVWNVATTYFLAEDYVNLDDEEATNGLSNMLNALCGGSEAFLVLKETPEGTVKGSFRSTKRDISRFAKAMGGGGHKKAAGFVVPGRLVPRPDGSVRIVDEGAAPT